MDLPTALDRLKSSPNEGDIQLVLEQLAMAPVASRVGQLELISTIITHTVPVYESLQPRTQALVVQALRSVIGISNLLLRMAQAKTLPTCSLYMAVVDHVFRPGLVGSLLRNWSPGEPKEIDRLVFKGRAYALVNETVAAGRVAPPGVFCLAEAHVSYLVHELLALYQNHHDATTINLFFNSISVFNGSSLTVLFDVLFSPHNWGYFVRSFTAMKRYERKAALTKLCSYVAKRYTGKDPAHVTALASVLAPVAEPSLMDGIFLEKIVSAASVPLNMVVAVLIGRQQTHSIVAEFLSYWANVHLIKSESLSKQDARTHLLIAMLAQCPPEFLEQLSRTETFLQAVLSRLESLLPHVKALAVVLSDKLCAFAGIDPIFSMDALDGCEVLVDPASYLASPTLDDPDFAWEVLSSPTVEPDIDLISRGLTTLNHSDLADSDDEPDQHVPNPLYIEDMLRYIDMDSQKPLAYEHQTQALVHGPTLIRQKASFGTELSFRLEQLLTRLIALTNHFNDAQFEHRRLNCLIAVVVGDVSSAKVAVSLLGHGDYSLQQRMCLLSTLGLAARELRGFDDDVVTALFTPTQFPSQMLPEHLHQQYLDYGAGAVQLKIQHLLLAEASADAADQLAGGKVLRISRGLHRKHAVPQSTYKNIGPDFFFPLVALWHDAGGQINIGHYSGLLVGHFLRTLVMILHAAYPLALHNDMVREFLQLVLPVIKKVDVSELQVIDSVVTGILLVCDACDAQYLVSNYATELHFVQQWLTLIWERIIDDKVKSACAGLLLRLDDMTRSMERLFLDTMNNFY